MRALLLINVVGWRGWHLKALALSLLLAGCSGAAPAPASSPPPSSLKPVPAPSAVSREPATYEMAPPLKEDPSGELQPDLDPARPEEPEKGPGADLSPEVTPEPGPRPGKEARGESPVNQPLKRPPRRPRQELRRPVEKGPPAPLVVRAGRPKVLGALDRGAAQQLITRRLPSIRSCIKQILSGRKRFSGGLTLRLVIGSDGKVWEAIIQRRSRYNPALEACVLHAARQWRFPPITGGAKAVAIYPLRYKKTH